MTFKNFWFQLHWILGITAGLVLMVVGTTGGILSFEREILRALNTDLMEVQPAKGAVALAPEELLKRVQRQYPERKINGLTLSKDPYEAAKINFALEGKTKRARKGETRYLDPYTAEVRWQDVSGKSFFRTVLRLHRWLLLDEPGKQVVGASTIALVLLVLSGLYLRWPRTWSSLKTWFTFSFKKTGRSFLSSLHAVIGTWVMIFLLLASLTGLYWSYDWYRAGLYAISGVPQPVRKGPPKEAQQGKQNPPAEMQTASNKSERGEQRAQKETAQPKQHATDFTAVGQAWQAFEREVTEYGYSSVTLRLPKPNADYGFTYFDPDPQHPRARNRLTISAESGEALNHSRYEDKALNEKLMSSMLPLHTGEFFGLIGRILLFISSLSLLLFGITGILLYLDRRKTAKLRRAAKQQANLNTVPLAQADTVIAYASQNGNAERLAWLTGQIMQDTASHLCVVSLNDIEPQQLHGKSLVLLIASTFGEGEAPDNARRFEKHLNALPVYSPETRFAVLALGDRHYETFCTFGLALDNGMRQSGATPLTDCILVDKMSPKNLQDWQALLVELGGNDQISLLNEPDEWRLIERQHLNPGSAGLATYHLEFEPVNAKTVDWQAGDLVEVCIKTKRETLTRQYSIASIPQNGTLQLLVRQVRFDDGTLGQGSGYLTDTLPVGDTALMTIQPHTSFQLATQDSTPLILIGNGTGLAGLRAHLMQRIQQGHHQNWLFFGERNRTTDFYYQNTLETWLENGDISKLCLAFSRDGDGYVQDRLFDHASAIQTWVENGAIVMVCGSAETMAKSVDKALKEILGSSAYQTLAESGRYLRDIY